MKMKRIRWVVSIAAFALLGTILLQGYWIHHAWQIHLNNQHHRLMEVAKHSAQQIASDHSKRRRRRSTAVFISNVQSSQDTHFDPSISSSISSHSNQVHEVIVINGDTIKNSQLHNQHPTTKTQSVTYSRHSFSGNDSTLLEFIQALPLDSILSEEMASEQLNIAYQYEIVSTDSNPNVTANSHDFNRVTVPIFRGQERTHPLLLKIEQNNGQRRLPPWFILMVIGSIICSSTMIWAFWFVVNGLLKQKKIHQIKTDFINNITHEFKTPISTIQLAAVSLKHEQVQSSNEQIDYYANVIHAEGKKLNGQVEKVLQTAQMESNQLQLQFALVDLNEIILNAIEQFHLIIDQKGGTIHYSSTNPVRVMGNKEHLGTALNNLIDNAIKYARKKPEIHIRLKETQSSFLIEVADNGIGMSPAEQKRLFTLFYRAENGDVHSTKGFGLGLHYVQYIIQQHKGKVAVESTVGKGATFSIELPKKY